MTTHDIKKSIKAGVEDAIKTGKAKMRPRSYFVVRSILLIIGSGLLALTLVYLTSFVFFVMRVSGVWFVPAFGPSAVGVFFKSLPWVLIIIAIVFVIILEWLVKRYALAWRKPLLYSTFGIIGFVLVSGFIVAQTSLHRGAFEYAENDKLPLIGPLYRGYGKPHLKDIHPGTILELTENGLIIETRDGERWNVEIVETTRLPFGGEFVIGDAVIIHGEKDDDVITAFGIRTADDRFKDFHQRPRSPMMPPPEDGTRPRRMMEPAQ